MMCACSGPSTGRIAKHPRIHKDCANHSCSVKRKEHARWRSVVKKVIFKNLSAFFSASGRRSFRNLAMMGCADTA